MNKQPFFTIVTVCWNSDKTISRTIESVLGQNFKDYEYVIVDGGSTDGTIDIIKAYEPRFEGRLKYSSEPDKGIYDAFNKGIERATGKYIWLVNSDDYIEPGVLAKLHDLVKDCNEGDEPIISAIMNCISSDGQTLYQVKSSPEKVAAAYRNNTMGTIHPATIVPKRIYDIVGLYDINYKIIGDIDWFKRAYKAQVPIIFADFVVTNFMVGGVSTASGSAKSRKDRKYLLKKFYPNFFAFYYQYCKWLAAFYITRYIKK